MPSTKTRRSPTSRSTRDAAAPGAVAAATPAASRAASRARAAKKLPGDSLKAEVTRKLARRISAGEGASLPTQEQLAAELGVSRTVLREACAVLQAKGMIELRQKTGVIVRPSHEWRLFDADVVKWRFGMPADARFHRDVLDFRNTIEVMAASLAAERASADEVDTLRRTYAEMERAARAFDRGASRAEAEAHTRADTRFHLTILAASRNQFLQQMAAIIESALKLHNAFVERTQHSLEGGLPLHKRVLAAIEAGDAQRAGAEMRELLAHALREMRAGVERA